jgi:DNA-binding transcriptional MerR regulator
MLMEDPVTLNPLTTRPLSEHSWAATAAPTGDHTSGTSYTVEELAHKVGMSPRNIRSHQARKLLPPPTRRGRTAYYDDNHVRRLEAIKSLQRQGFNLVSIEAILGVRTSDPGTQALIGTLRRLAADQPALVYALSRHGVVGTGDGGGVQLARPRAVQSALELRNVGMPAVPALHVLSEVLDSVRGIGQELVQSTSKRILSLTPEQARRRPSSWEDLDRYTVALTQGVVNLLTQALRVVIENHAEVVVSDLVAQHTDQGLHVAPTPAAGNG